MKAHLSRVVIDIDEDGEEISTLIVDFIEDDEPKAVAPRASSIPAQQRLLMEVLADAISEAGSDFRIPRRPHREGRQSADVKRQSLLAS